MNSSYKSQLLRNLCDHQLATATREQLIAVADRAETLISELNANAEMGFAGISQTLIGCPDRIDSTISNEQLSEQILQHDLRLLAEDFTDAEFGDDKGFAVFREGNLDAAAFDEISVPSAVADAEDFFSGGEIP